MIYTISVYFRRDENLSHILAFRVVATCSLFSSTYTVVLHNFRKQILNCKDLYHNVHM